MTAVASEVRKPSGSQAALEWSEIEVMAPQLARTMRRYLAQLATFLAPLSVVAADSVLRQFARWLLANTGVENVADIRRDDLEDFKVWLAARRGIKGDRLSPNTHRQRLRTLRAFFERIIEWDWPDAPPRNPVLGGDIPKKPEPLPKFPGDRDAAKLMTAVRASSDYRDRSPGSTPQSATRRHRL
jgi:site-specific recombinase XerD